MPSELGRDFSEGGGLYGKSEICSDMFVDCNESRAQRKKKISASYMLPFLYTIFLFRFSDGRKYLLTSMEKKLMMYVSKKKIMV